MNDYSLTSDSRRWWWPSAAAGTAGATAIVAILVLPAVVQAAAEPVAPAEPAYTGLVSDTGDHQCFLLRANWNEGLDGFQPRCGRLGTPPVRDGVRRPGLGYLP